VKLELLYSRRWRKLADLAHVTGLRLTMVSHKWFSDDPALCVSSTQERSSPGKTSTPVASGLVGEHLQRYHDRRQRQRCSQRSDSPGSGRASSASGTCGKSRRGESACARGHSGRAGYQGEVAPVRIDDGACGLTSCILLPGIESSPSGCTCTR
jgi:hypothetical protein